MSKKFFISNLYYTLIILNDIQINLITLKIAENQSEMIQKGQKNQKIKFARNIHSCIYIYQDYVELQSN